MAKVKNPLAVGNTGRGRASRRGSDSYDNPRENIDPHVKTQVVSTQEFQSNEMKLKDGTGAGFVKNDANGVLSGGNAGGGTGDIEGVTAGDGLSGGGTTGTVTLAVDLNELTTITTIERANDFLSFADATDNGSKKILLSYALAQTDHTAIQNIGTNTHAQIDTHIADNSQAHSDYLINNGDDTTSGKITAANLEVTGDNNSNDTSYMGMVLHGTDSSPPTASNYPHGTLYFQYAA
jgi:hypothetical protein